MNLVADIGNTRSKFAIFHADELVKNQSYDKSADIEDFKHFIKLNTPIDNLIYSAVGKFEFEPSLLNVSGHCIELNHKIKLPIELLYSTKNTLGADRIAAVVGGSKRVTNSNVLIIDAGSCITFDFVNSKNQYLGGSISPGLNMRFRTLNTFTENLPLLSNEKATEIALIGNSTEDSISSGVINGTIEEVIGMTDKYYTKYKDLNIILTGGDYPLFQKVLHAHFLSKKNMIFADPNLVLTGLNAILNFNVK